MSDHQLTTLRIYSRLAALRKDWGGALVLGCGVDALQSGAVPAALIAGAALLLVASDVHEVKKAYRRGEVDFIVNSLDEAVRALKNEVRRKRPLSVALVTEVDKTLGEIVERGVQPDAFLTTRELLQDVQPLIDRGMQVFDVDAMAGPDSDEWFVVAASSTKLREADARLLRLMAKDEVVRRRWMEGAARYLRGASDGRWVYLDEYEVGLLESEGLRLRSPEEYRPTAS